MSKEVSYALLQHAPVFKDEAAERQTVARALQAEGTHEAPGLRVEHFLDPRLAAIWGALQDLEVEDAPLDWPTVADRAEVDAAFLAEVVLEAPTSASLGYYAQRVSEAHAVRQLQHALLTSLVDVAQRGPSHAEKLSKALEALEATQESNGGAIDALSAPEAVEAARAELEAKIEAQMRGVQPLRSGIEDLDGLVSELRRGEMTVLAARPSMGKTAVALNMARFAMETGRRALFVSLETPKTRLAVNLSAQVLREPMGLVAQRTDLLVSARIECSAMPGLLEIVERTRTVGDVRRLVARARGEIDLVFVDYLQLIRSSSPKRNRYEEVSEVSREIKQLAMDYSLHVVALAQLNRGNESRPNKRPLLGDLRDSGQIEQDADVCLLLHREGYYDRDADPRELEIAVAKQRNGPVGLARARLDLERNLVLPAGARSYPHSTPEPDVDVNPPF